MDDFEVDSVQSSKRRWRNDDGNSIDESMDDKGGAGSETRCKRLKTNDLEEFTEDRAEDAVTDLFEIGSFVEDDANNNLRLITKVQTDNGNVDTITPLCKAFRKTRDIFDIDLNFDDYDKCSEKDSGRTEVESAFFKAGDAEYFAKLNDEKSVFVDSDKIRTTDIPERMQLRSPPAVSASEEELISEAYWIYEQAFERRTVSVQDSHLKPEAKEHAKKSPKTVSKIVIVLDLLKNQHLEVPFIAFYRKEYVLPELNINDLWKVYKFDAEWSRVRERRGILKELFEMMKAHQATSLQILDGRRVEEDDFEMLDNAQTMEDLNECFRHFVFHYGPEIYQSDETLNEAGSTGPYSVYLEAGLGSLVKKFGLSSKNFADNVRLDIKVHEIERESVVPRVLASNYTSEKFQTVEEVLKAAQTMMAMQIASEPSVKRSLRKLYSEQAKISVRPTKKGIENIRENHPVYTMKYLKDKPVKDLVGEQYLKLAMAQDDELVVITFSDEIVGDCVKHMKELFHSDEVTRHAQQWNFLRAGIIELALKIAIHDLKKDLHSTLLAEAKDSVTRACAHRVYDWLKIAPYRPIAKEDGDDLRVMGIAYSADTSTAAFACIVTPDGECKEYLNLPNLLALKNSPLKNDKATMTIALAAVKSMIDESKPHVIVIAGESAYARDIAEEFRKMSDAAVEIVENGPAVVYSTSCRAIAEFPSYPAVLRQAISLARRLQDPLVEFSQLCNADEEILTLKLHSLQDQVSSEELLENVYLEFVNRVNEVGVDVNKAVRLPYFGNLLQFVGGLGRRKAQYLVDTLKQLGKKLESRDQLTLLCHIGPVVFTNCSGFLKIDTPTEILDGTRVHPQNYDWAGHIAASALDYEPDEMNFVVALEEIIGCPERLKELDLDAYAVQLEEQGFGNKCVTLHDIRSELTSRYKDLRIPYQSPSANKLIEIFTRESPTDFYVGKLVDAMVEGVSNGLTWIRLNNGLFGYIHTKNLSDKHTAGRIGLGSRIRCRVVQIETEKFCVEASSRDYDVADRNYEWRLPKDPYYDFEAEAKDSPIIEKPVPAPMQVPHPRREITHRCFRNVNWIAAEKLLKTMRQGETIIRPSSKGDEFLCFTWKVTDDLYQHIAVRDESVRNKLRLGGSLWVGNEEYRDFDDVIDRYINPIASYAWELLNFKYYKAEVMGVQMKAEEVLTKMKRTNPLGIPYIVSADKNHPGKFVLSYLLQDQCRHNYIAVTPAGYRFGGYIFKRLSDLMIWFKNHSKDPIPEPVTPAGPRAHHPTFAHEMQIKPDIYSPVMQKVPNGTSNSTCYMPSQTTKGQPFYSQIRNRIL